MEIKSHTSLDIKDNFCIFFLNATTCFGTKRLCGLDNKGAQRASHTKGKLSCRLVVELRHARWF